MVISDTRVQSVLRTYSNQLQKSKLSRKLDGANPRMSGEKVTISEEARRRTIMEQVTSRALEQACTLQDVSDQLGNWSVNN